jgi:hypothetical protein
VLSRRAEIDDFQDTNPENVLSVEMYGLIVVWPVLEPAPLVFVSMSPGVAALSVQTTRLATRAML